MTDGDRRSGATGRSDGGSTPTLERVARLPDRIDLRSAVAAVLAAGTGLVVFLVAVELFPYHSVNHDEAVYLQQARLLLEGRLGMAPRRPDAVRPWFFVDDGGYLYPRYAPVPAGVFAAGKLLGGYRVALAVVAAANVYLTYAVTAAAFDRRTGLLAGGLLALTPAFLLTSAVFLPYAPTTALNLLFAVAYVRAGRRSGRARVGYAALAGVAVGLAFFGRPYTAVLFAAPFVVHSVWSLAAAVRPHTGGSQSDESPTDPPSRVDRLRSRVAWHGPVAVLGAAFVGVTLAYNATLTGSPTTFPFEVFAPKDGLGFGRRRMLDHAVDYTPKLAVRANAHLLWETFTRWTALPPVGSLAFAVGVGRFLLGRYPADSTGGDHGEATEPGSTAERRREDLPDRRVGWILAGVAVSVVAGNVYFWGTYNVLGRLGDPTDGFVGGFGPFYHFDLLVVVAAFGAVGARTLWGPLDRALDRVDHAGGRRVAVAALVVLAVPAAGALQWRALDGPVADHAAYTERYAETYDPLEARSFDRAVVFVPPAYGPWLNHPFQSLRNDPGPDGRLEGPVVYALDRSTAEDFAVLEAYPDRRPYRFNYHGRWTPDPEDRVVPKLRRLRVRTGRAVTVETRVSVPPNVRSGYVRLATGEGDVTETLADPDGRVTVRWRVTADGAAVREITVGNRSVPVGDGPAGLSGPDEASLAVTFVTPDGATLTYRQELDVRPRDGDVQVVWPPESSVCRLVTDCGLEGTYLPDRPDLFVEGVGMRSNVTVDP